MKFLYLLLFLIAFNVYADSSANSDNNSSLLSGYPGFELHGDMTLIDQWHGGFNHRFPDGTNSLSSSYENSYSSVEGLVGSYDFGQGTQFVSRLEMIRGIPLSGAGGLAALTNNDVQRVMYNRFQAYIALAYLSHTINFGDIDITPPPEDANLDKRLKNTAKRVNFIIGKVDVLSMFDPNTYAHKGDNQFLNWCFMTSCAYDYAADARGYTYGLGSQLDWGDYSVRAGYFAMPILPNQLAIDQSIGHHFGANFEVERRWQSGALRFLAYQGRMDLTNYASYLNQTGVLVQQSPKYNAKRGGAGLNLEQSITKNIGFFARAFRDSGTYESMAFTEADASYSAGLSFDGSAWSREGDNIGIGYIQNQINSVRQQFLAAGNYDLFIGDGNLLYAPEEVLETYYRYRIRQGVELTADWQYIQNPAYNQYRGPVNVYAFRLHLEF
ncbi:carbohydrate porin [Ferrovum sp. PN-J185]|uniref:carbohydrate porin n=1 Tax=Ferrovum sp. PN-J185 TaxID=1356306 RepID=UPI000799E957|nr:carbohydrate porin [Ferrovum sp. PN-J185]KXW56467.1 carbohydrate-selective porin, OprB family [Ferrovum sp. PN-J185]MCC6068184.1 carbohydrate porin [Ferrovum sp. PN-J185]